MDDQGRCWTVKNDVERSFLYCLDHFQGGVISGLRCYWKQCPKRRGAAWWKGRPFSIKSLRIWGLIYSDSISFLSKNFDNSGSYLIIYSGNLHAGLSRCISDWMKPPVWKKSAARAYRKDTIECYKLGPLSSRRDVNYIKFKFLSFSFDIIPYRVYFGL